MAELKRVIRNFVKKNIFKVVISITLFLVSAFISVLPAKVYAHIINQGFMKSNLKIVQISCGLLIGIYIARALFSYLSNNYLIVLGNELVASVKETIYERLFTLDLNFYAEKEIGYLNTRVEEISKLDAIFSNVSISFLASVLECLFTIYIISTISIKFLIILLIPIPLLVFVSYRVSKLMAESFNKTFESGAHYSGKISESLRGIENIKSLGLEEHEKRKISNYNKQTLENIKSQAKGINKFGSGMNVVGSIISVFIYLIGGVLIVRNNLSIGSFIAVSMYAGKLYSPFLGYVGTYIILAPALVSLKRVAELFFDDAPCEISKEKYYQLSEIHTIEFKDISISYKDKEVLSNLSLKINKGDKIQIFGKNGSGKSSLIKVLLKVIRPSKGRVFINDIDYELISKETILRHVSYVPQKIFIFNSGVIQNINYGIKEYSKEKLLMLLEGLGLTELIERLEKSGDSKVGENGFKLSGGEIQKIAIARALLQDKDIFIFDEATNNLDRKSIEFLKDYIMRSNKTWILVDHQNDFTQLGFRTIDLDSYQSFKGDKIPL
ncbi:ABC-type multidrug transport system, ATPase and permease component [Fervidobacterium changbaicum]|uniref:ABC transporter ATP-binding protein/permease n=1 Tax=Fervidobacterium changbaicum TaxID=310769 RepID=UPI000881875C|nr:ABC transporter ATP-binding protein [Fervidobacterium changbaicum]SDG89497.1 ABC-type multidrug transport system, ATPase and permease component [Fervidobacterium changbaicum]